MNWFHRKLMVWNFVRHANESVQRRANVEEILFDVAHGKRPVPSLDEFRQLALYLGTRGMKKPAIKR